MTLQTAAQQALEALESGALLCELTAASMLRVALEAEQAQAVVPATGDAEDKWRKLALQFDGQRMQALGHLRAMTLNPHAHMSEAMKFLAAPPTEAQQVAVPVAVLDAISRAGFMLVKTQLGYSLLPTSRIEAQGLK